MYFKKLELIGFKSFAEKTTIQFEPGVTAIVGPNGCGKSNIADSIRWALGEQSAKSLRGASMQDVIFNGSASREPLNLAEVSLTISNESRILSIDYEEVTITRRLYRSGESEYLINKNPVRLKDIHDLLMGTGIGTDHYSIIEQGKMDLILNSKPEDRRTIFEEAAGITKFKSQKQEALRKLEQTEQNLLRINDIVQEVKRQIGSIERQAKKAEHYRAEYEKLKSLELSAAGREFFIFDGRKKTQEQELELCLSQEKELAAKVETLDQQCQQKRTELQSLEETLRRDQADQMTIAGQIRSAQDRVLLNRERVGELVERKNNLLKQAENTKKRIEEFSAEYAGLNAEFEQAKHEEQEGLVFLGAVEADFASIESFMQQTVSRIEAAQQTLSQLSVKKADVQNQLSDVRAQGSALNSRVERLKTEELVQAQEMQKIQADYQQASTGFLSAQQLIDSLQSTKAVQENTHSAITQEIKTKEETLNLQLVEESTLLSKIDFLKDLKNRHEGFLSGVKALLEEKSRDGDGWAGMAGLLADQVKVEPGYELAVEAALESYLQAVVFRGAEELMRAVDFLRTASKGRALLLNLACDGASVQNQPSSPPPLEPILKYVVCEASFQPLLRGLIGNVYLADGPRQAYDTVKDRHGIICVTKEGERFESQVVMGGSHSASAEITLVGREARIRDYEEQKASVSGLIGRIQDELGQLRDKQSVLTGQIQGLAQDISQTQMELGDKKSRLWHLEELKKKEETRYQLLLQDLTSAGDQQKALDRSQQLNSQLFDQIQQEEKTVAEAIAGFELAIKGKLSDKEALLVRLTETRSRQGSYTARREKIEKDRSWIVESRLNQQELLVSFESESQSTDSKREGLELENRTLELQISDLSSKRDGILVRLEGLGRDREAASASVEQWEAQKQKEFAQLSEIKDKIHTFQMEGAQIQFSIDRLKERIFNAYQIDLLVQEQIAQTQQAAVPGADSGFFDLEAARAQIQAQREKLSKMGPVNLAAMEEYEEFKNRYDFLTKQQQDLVKAKEDLHQAILKINRTTKELFVETFAKIQRHFHEYYRLLFNGGQAELIMMDEQNVLECGIEIVARPPGKKLQSITLLSGGEKALTAIALLFALFKVKPSPFCILDEMDAPLDETNVERFCRLLKDFISESQFILITHNKRTINLSDAMYGITMAQSGVSQIVSVRFAEKDAEKSLDNQQTPVAV